MCAEKLCGNAESVSIADLTAVWEQMPDKADITELIILAQKTASAALPRRWGRLLHGVFPRRRGKTRCSSFLSR